MLIIYLGKGTLSHWTDKNFKIYHPMTFWMGVQKTRKERTIIIIMLAFAFGSACLHFHRRKKNISFSETYHD